jgi:cell wall-associated NlpC family hydrolase
MPWEEEIPEGQKSPEGELVEGAKGVGRRGSEYGKKKAGEKAEKGLEKGAEKAAEKGGEKLAEKGLEKGAEYAAGAAASAAATPVAGAAVKAGVKAGMKIKKFTLDKIIPQKYQWACCGISCILSSCGGFFVILFTAVIIFAAATGFFKEGKVSGLEPTKKECGFDESKLSKYEGGGPNDPLDKVLAGKEYATNTLGISESDIRIYQETETFNLIRDEIYIQWSKVTNKHGSSQADAQRAILSYARHEGGLAKFKQVGSGLQPIYDEFPSGPCVGYPTYFPLSITCDKYKGSKNKQYAVAWDMKYAIYLGVKENLDAFQSNNVSGEGLERWKNTIAYVFLPSNPSRYWDARAQKAWDEFANETEHKCVTSDQDLIGSETKVIEVAKTQLGKPYKYAGGCGGEQCKSHPPPEGYPSYDCSGFTAWCYYWGTDGRIKLSHGSYEQRNQCNPISQNEAHPGDLIFWRGGGHVGLYVGDGKYIHAPHTGDVVKISNLRETNEFRRPKGL